MDALGFIDIGLFKVPMNSVQQIANMRTVDTLRRWCSDNRDRVRISLRENV